MSSRWTEQAKNRAVPLLTAIAFFLILHAVVYGFFLEDAYIFLRYAEQTHATGIWSTWNLGEPPVSGASSPAWLAILVLGRAAGLSPYFLSKALGFVGSLLTFSVVFSVYLRRTSVRGPVVDGLLALSLVSLWPFAFYGVSGMETPCYLALVLGILYCESGPAFAGMAALMVFLRPEAPLIILFVALARFGLVRAVKLGAPAAILYAVYILWHRSTFGTTFPNTYYAKADLPLSQSLVFGTRYTLNFASDMALYIFAACLGLLRSRAVAAKVAFPSAAEGALAVATLIVVLKTGADAPAAFPYFRHYLPLTMILWTYATLAFMSAARAAVDSERAARIVGVTLCLAASLLLSYQFTVRHERDLDTQIWHPIRDTLRRLVARGPLTTAPMVDSGEPTIEDILGAMPDGSTFATTRAGRIPYEFLRLNAIDLLGLNDTHIARYGRRAWGGVDARSDAGYVLGRRPEVIELVCDSAGVAASILDGRLSAPGAVPFSDREILTEPRLREEYAFVPSTERAVFVRRDAVRYLRPGMTAFPIAGLEAPHAPSSGSPSPEP